MYKKGGTKKIFVYFIQRIAGIFLMVKIAMKTAEREIVVDGYNLMHKLYPSLNSASLEQLRQATEIKLLGFQLKKKWPVTIVYDGKGSHKESLQFLPLHIVFTPASISADLWIIDYVKSLNTKVKIVTIVSSDDEIRRYATAFGATCIKSEKFALELNKIGNFRSGAGCGNEKKFKEASLSDQEVSRWMKLFSDGRS